MKTSLRLTAVFEAAEEGGFIGSIEEMPGVNTQGETIEKTKANLLEALTLVVETHRSISETELKEKKALRKNPVIVGSRSTSILEISQKSIILTALSILVSA